MSDLISRKELLTEIQRIYNEHYQNANNQTIHDIFYAVFKRIDRAKGAKDEPIIIHKPTKSEFRRMAIQMGYERIVHGHWVYDHWCEFKCSNCGGWSNSEPYRGREKYCPNCGANMDESK